MEDDQLKTKLPPSLERKFRDLEAGLWRKETATAVFGSLVILQVGWLLLFASDRLQDSPVWLRSMLLGGSLTGVLACITIWMRHWVWDRRGNRKFARIIQHEQRRLGDRLLGAVELAEGAATHGDVSPALRRAAIRQVSESTAGFDFTSVIDRSGGRRLMLICGLVLASVVGTAVVAPQAALNALARFGIPFANIERFTFVALKELPGDLIVPHSETFLLNGRVAYHGFWQPNRGRAQFEAQKESAVSVVDGSIEIVVPGQVEAGNLTVQIGDAKKNIAIKPTYRPALRKLNAAIQFPDYLQHEATTSDFSGTSLTVLEGSKVTVNAEATRDLAAVSLRLGKAEPLDLPSHAGRFTTPQLAPAGLLAGSITIQDQLGLSNAAPTRFLIQTRPDDPPQVSLEDLPLEFSMLESDVLPLKLYAEDDFGVKLAGVTWTGLNSVSNNQSSLTEFKIEAKSAKEKTLTNTFIFSPIVLGVPPETTVEIRGAARDFHPTREPSSSLTHRIHIVGNVRHAEMVRQQLDALFARLEEITRDEESVAQKTSELKNTSNEDLNSKKSEKKAGELAGDQGQTQRQLSELARDGTEILREALRNPVIDQKTLRDWTKNLSAMDQIAKQEMQKATEGLQSAQEQEPKRQENLASAEQAQQEALKKLQELQKDMNDGLDNLQALTLAQRLRRMAGREGRVVDQLQSVISESIGLLPRELPRTLTLLNERLAGNQSELSGEAKTLQDEIGRFFDRTQKPNYGSVNREMKEANAETELQRIGELIESNIAMESMQNLTDWMKWFQDWAKRLEPPEEESSGGKGGAGSPQSQKLLKMLISFIRIRMNEVGLHQQTKLLDSEKERQANYRDAVTKLAEVQRDLHFEFSDVQMDNTFEQLKEPLMLAQASITIAEDKIFEPSTSPETQKAQVQAIADLSDLINLINEQAKRQKPSGQSQQQQQQAMQEMEMLMQLARQQMQQGMSPMAGQQPGMGNAGGGKGQGGSMSGSNGTGVGDGRKNDRASGQSRQIPAEFRKVMEKYFKAVEEAEKK